MEIQHESSQSFPMEGKTVLITGATSGVGEATARQLAALGARVIVHGRTPERCQAVAGRIQAATGLSVEFLAADLADLSQVWHLAEEMKQRCPRLDVLINNAGAFFLRRQLSPDGLEMTLAVNHLSHFLLTHRLLDLLKTAAHETGQARVVVVASNSHVGQVLDFGDLELRRNYGGMKAYGRSKLANLLFAYELARRLEGTGVTANALHPGFVATEIGKNNGFVARLAMNLMQRSGLIHQLTPDQGAKTSVYLASSPDVAGVSGKYFVKCQSVPSTPASYDQEAAARLWEISTKMVRIYQPSG